MKIFIQIEFNDSEKKIQIETMKLQDQCTTVEQSKKLLELGSDKETASLNWVLASKIDATNEDYISSNTVGMDIIPHIPCWTVADMMELIHSYRGFSVNVLGQIEIFSLHEPAKEIIGRECTIRDDYSILRDNLFDCLVRLKENKYL